MSSSWFHLELDGKTLDLRDPPGPARGVIVFLHAYDLKTLRDHAAATALLDELRLACVCPPGGYFWWVDRPCHDFHPECTPEQWLVDRVVPAARQRWKLGERAVGLLGVSMGGQAALRVAFRYPEQFPAIAALAPAIEYHQLHGQGSPLDDLYDSQEQCRQDTAPMHIRQGHTPPHLFFCCDPDDDYWFRGCDRLKEKFVALGVEHEADLATRAGGHTWTYFDRQIERAIRFLANGLHRQSLRLM